MTRDQWPPRYANVPVRVIRLPKHVLPPAAKETYCKIRGLAWSEPTLRIDLDVLLMETGLSRTRLFEYARLLRLCNALLWHCSGSVFECSFVDDEADTGPAAAFAAPEAEMPYAPAESASAAVPESGTVTSESRNPGLRDSLIKIPPPQDSEVKSQEIRTNPAIRDSGIRKPRAPRRPAEARPPKASTREIQAEFTRLVRLYEGEAAEIRWAEGEGQAAKKIGERRSVAEFREFYEHCKASPFWAAKRLNLRNVLKDIEAYFGAKAAGRLNGSARGKGGERASHSRHLPEHNRPDAGQLARDMALRAERDARRDDP